MGTKGGWCRGLCREQACHDKAGGPFRGQRCGALQRDEDRRGRSVPLHRNPRRSPALIVCQVGAPQNVPRAAAMAQCARERIRRSYSSRQMIHRRKSLWPTRNPLGETTPRAHVTDRWRRAWSAPRSITRHAGERHHRRLFRLGDQLSGIQGHRRAGLAVERFVTLAGGL
jgi:hypothetical protein